VQCALKGRGGNEIEKSRQTETIERFLEQAIARNGQFLSEIPWLFASCHVVIQQLQENVTAL
jgi:hypothetical protein